MTFLNCFANIIEASEQEYRQLKSGIFISADLPKPSKSQGNILAFGDNGSFMKYLCETRKLSGKFQMIYIDPPFFSKANYEAQIKVQEETGERTVKHRAYEDVWKQGMQEYLKMLALRFRLIKDLLNEEGTVWIHLDWHVVHYAKILLDEIFGEKNFINEIIWVYKSGGSGKKHFARKHDTILVYSKTSKYYLNLPKEKSYNRGLKPYRFKGVEEFCDEIGWYTMVNMKDVWSIDMVGRTSSERTGYATQKPEALLNRIITAASRPGDLVGDFFAGSGTCCAVAEKIGRPWIGCDSGAIAIASTMKRCCRLGSEFELLMEEGRKEELQIKVDNEQRLQMVIFPEEEGYKIEV